MSAPLRAGFQSGPARLPVGLNEVEARLRIEDDQSAADAPTLAHGEHHDSVSREFEANHPGGAIGRRG